MATLYSVILSKEFKKFLTIQIISPTIAISLLITTVLLFSTTSIYAEEIENEAVKYTNKPQVIPVETQENELNPNTQKYLNDGREILKLADEQIKETHEQWKKDDEAQKNKSYEEQEPEMTDAEKKAANDPEYAALLKHNKELYEKEHPGWQNKPDQLYKRQDTTNVKSNTPIQDETPFKHPFGKATIPFLGAWEEDKIADHKLIYCIDDSVDPYLEANARDAFNYWSTHLYKLNNKETVIAFWLVQSCKGNEDIKIMYKKDSDNDSGFAAQTITVHNKQDEIHHATVIIYANSEYYRSGFDYERSGEFGDLPEYHKNVANDGPSDDKYYQWQRNNLKHEVGHVLGLDHTDNPNYLMFHNGDYEKEYTVSNCELSAVIKKNFVERDLDKVICEPS